MHQFTISDVDAFPYHGNRYELLQGILLATPPSTLPHQTVASELAGTLATFLDDEPEVETVARGVILRRPHTQLVPDVLVLAMPRIAEWEAVEHHWLVAEVSDVHSRTYDREYKRDAYLQLGVREVWLVDLDERCVFVSRPGSASDQRYDSTVTWTSPGGRELVVDIAGLFRSLPR